MNAGDDPVLHAIFTRRVVRNMTDEAVAGSDFDTVLRAARAAPSAGNRRLQPVVPVSDTAQLRLLRMVSPGMLARPRAAAVVCIDLARAEAYGFAPDTPGLYIDVGTIAATMLLAAHALGLAAQPVTSFSRVAAARLLALPAELEPRMIVCLGHPAVEQPPPMGGWRSSTAA